MALPDVIEIVPWSPPSRAEVTVPGSKSITNRALVLAALADGETTLRGALWSGDTRENPLELFVGNAGTAARFLSAFVCLGEGVYRLHGVPRMHERPQAALFGALRQLGYQIDSPNDRLPAVIHGAGPRAGRCTVSIEDSSQ